MLSAVKKEMIREFLMRNFHGYLSETDETGKRRAAYYIDDRDITQLFYMIDDEKNE